jgi:hypothetical protein
VDLVSFQAWHYYLIGSGFYLPREPLWFPK